MRAAQRLALTRWRSLARTHTWSTDTGRTTVDPVPTALLSVYDKSGIAELAAALHDEGWTILSSGGTAAAVAAAGVPVTDVAELTGFPAILGHRVVTLHPKVHGGILADPTDPAHQADLAAFGIGPIALVVVNLYPFGDDPGIELIDVGGPAMVRAAAKNHAHVAVVVDPADYDAVVAEIVASGGVDASTRRRLARRAFATTADYDRAIVDWLDDTSGRADDDADLPDTLRLTLQRAQPLRYGENPHQRAARYRFDGVHGWWDAAVQHGGKEMSYLNVYDTEAAWRLVHRFGSTACVIVKHANPCGVAVDTGGLDVAEVYRRAHACDPVSAFGGIVAVNRDVTAAMAEALGPVFTEVVVAPGYEPAALATLTARRNLRVLEAPRPAPWRLDVRPVDGGLLVQTPDPVDVDPRAWSVVTARPPEPGQLDDLALGVDGLRRRQLERHRARRRRPGRRHRWGSAQPRRFGTDRHRPRRGSGHRRGGRQRRLLPLPRRHRRARHCRRGGDRPAGWQRPRRRGDRRRRRAGHRHGVHRRAPLPPLDTGVPRPRMNCLRSRAGALR